MAFASASALPRSPSPPHIDPDLLPVRDASPSYARRSLLLAARELRSRGLDNAATWALELVVCLPDDDKDGNDHAPKLSGESFFSRLNSSRSRRTAAPSNLADSSLSWPGPFAPSSTPARPSSSRPSTRSHHPAQVYPMQSTPFLGAAGGSANSHIMVSGPSSSPLPTSSPHRNGEQGLHMLAARNTPSPIADGLGRIDASTSISGRFPPPFRQPPSPLATMSLSASADEHRSKTEQYDKDVKVEDTLHSDDDEDMQEDDVANITGSHERNGAAAQHSAHVHFAEGGAEQHSNNVSNLDIFDAYDDVSPTQIDVMEDAEYELARSYFRMGQLDRCKWVLERRRQARRRLQDGDEGDTAIFLRGYVGMLIVERNSQAAASLHTPPSISTSVAQSLIPILKDLIDPADSFLLLLKGIILRKLRKRLEAMDCFVRSLLLFPYNWTAWLELNGVIENSAGELNEILPLLPESFMRMFFVEHHHRQAEASKAPEQNAERVERLLGIFPQHAGLWISLAVGRYMQQTFDSSIEAFQQAFDLDPYRLEGLADYSNALFLMDKGDQLAHLAHTTSEWGAETAEVCCVVGNHFYYQSDHTRAIEAFKRAISLDPTCIAAWILLGHTFLEIKNSGAAGEMYRRAIDLNPRDYRPWHGLGKVYELLDCHTFATHYYLKAAGIAPYTGTIWQSLAMTYAKLERHREAVFAYRRYLSCEEELHGQLATIGSILGHLQALQDARVAALAERGEEEEGDDAVGDTTAATWSHSSAKRVAEEEADMTAWHRRAVRLLFSEDQNHQRAMVTSQEAAYDLTNQVSTSKLDLATWGESIVRIAKVEAGLDVHFDANGEQQGVSPDHQDRHLPHELLASKDGLTLSLTYLNWLLTATEQQSLDPTTQSTTTSEQWPHWRRQAVALKELLTASASASAYVKVEEKDKEGDGDAG